MMRCGKLDAAAQVLDDAKEEEIILSDGKK